MSILPKALDPAFQGVGSRPGIEIWRIENFQPVPLPKSEYGKFYMGDSYIVMQTSAGRGGSYLYDIHFWLGKDTSQDEAGTAAMKTVELDASLGGKAIQHREVQGHESDKFLSYFKPCIIPLEGGVASGFKKPEEEEFETRLYICKGKRVVKVKQVPFARSSLNHDDVFILDTKDKIFQFNGANSNIQERAKALEVTQFLKDTYHDGKCDVGIVDDGKLQAETDSGEFWQIFGGFAPIGRKVLDDDDIVPDSTPAKLYSVADGQLEPLEGELSKGMLENDKCYLLDCGDEIFVWFGRATQLEPRKSACQSAEDLITSQSRLKATRITRIIQGYESHAFKFHFDSWPAGQATNVDEGRAKRAAFLKQQQKGAAKGAGGSDEAPPLLEVGGKLEVWRVDGSNKTKVGKDGISRFYCGDCYIVCYTYHSGDKKEDFFLCWWIGKDSVQEDQETAAKLVNTMANSFKGRAAQGRIYQGKEPPQFVALFDPMFVLKGGLSSSYKKFLEANLVNDETYTADGVALFRIAGTAPHNTRIIQYDSVATSLNSHEWCVLQTSNAVFTWQGSQCPFEQQPLAVKVAEIVKPGGPMKHAKEGTENATFWNPIGGKQEYTSEKPSHNIVRDPHLFSFSMKKGKFTIDEIYHFSQDDLLTEDMLILDTHAEVFVWVGNSMDSKEKQTAFEMGQQFIELANSMDGLPLQVPLYRINEGHEPCFFAANFVAWDPVKTIVPGNSFQKKAVILFGEKSGSSQGGQRASGQGSQRAAALAALSGALTAEQKAEIAAAANAEKEDEAEEPQEGEEAAAEANEDDETALEDVQGTYTYEQLRAKSENPATGIDFKRREAYLSDEEFEGIFGMPKEEFYKLPRWKQDQQKKQHDLF